MLIASAWKEVYERFDNIMMMDVVEHIKDIDPIVIERPGKDTVYVRLLGDVCPQDGIAVYFSAEDFCIATQEECYIWCEGDAGLHMQTGIVGLYGKEEYVSRYNQNILRELGIQADGERKLLPHFDKMEYGYLPGKVTSAEADELVEILMHVERLLTEIGEIEEVPEGKVLLRQFDTEQKRWNNILTGHPIVSMIDQDQRSVPATVAVEALQKQPAKGTWSVVIQQKTDECLTENGKKYYPLCMSINAVRGSSMKLLNEVCFSPAELKSGALYAYLCDQMMKNGKPAVIQYDDEPTLYHMRPFCEVVGIRTENHAEDINNVLGELIQENRESFMQMMEETDEKDAGSVQKLEQFLMGALEKKMQAESSYVISVSLGTGLYRHIRICVQATLADLHYAIMEAFGLVDNGQAYTFEMTLKNAEKAHYMIPGTGADGTDQANSYVLGEIMAVGSKCTYTLSMEDNWKFTCKVLREIEEFTEDPVVIRKKGDNPTQHPMHDSDEE